MGSCCPKPENESPEKIETQSGAAEIGKSSEKNGEIINDKANNNNNNNLEKSNEINGGCKASEIMRAEEEKVALPHNYEAILKDADSPIDKSSPEKIYEQLYGGVFLNQKKKKYWVDKKTRKNCFMLFARELSIAWGNDDRYWTWSQLKETSTSDVRVDVAELLLVFWLDINGKFDTKNLSPGTMYEVVFVVMVTDDSSGWQVPVNLKLILPDGNKQEKTEILDDKPQEEWTEVHVGEFISVPEKGGNIEFYLYENEILGAKSGLLVKGAIIRPKSS
ncbi:hypothetical protein LguiB_033659 [Lonicera macranthoides]